MEASNLPEDDRPPDLREGETLAEYVQRQIQEALQGHTPPSVPKVESAPTTFDEATELGKMFAEYRAEVAALRAELQAHRPRVVHIGQVEETLEQRTDARLAAIAENPFYCPLCGRLSKYARECVGPDTTHPSHAPYDMVPTEELGGDPANHTKAPSTDPDQPDLVGVK